MPAWLIVKASVVDVFFFVFFFLAHLSRLAHGRAYSIDRAPSVSDVHTLHTSFFFFLQWVGWGWGEGCNVCAGVLTFEDRFSYSERKYKCWSAKPEFLYQQVIWGHNMGGDNILWLLFIKCRYKIWMLQLSPLYMHDIQVLDCRQKRIILNISYHYHCSIIK